MRSDLSQLRLDEQEIPELQLLLIRRRDIVTDHSRILTHLRGTLVSLFPALELALKLNGKGLLTHYQTPIHLRRAGQKRVATYPRETAASKDPIT
jgi:hypothetical protein